MSYKYAIVSKGFSVCKVFSKMYDGIRLVLVQVLADTGGKKKSNLVICISHNMRAEEALWMRSETSNIIYSTQFENFAQDSNNVLIFLQTN